MIKFFGSLLGQICILITLPLMIVLGVSNKIHRWCYEQCKGVWS